ncbi:unnamed protein product [Tenebrio molitor]|nr:unnamed protein product [Tenebrio molitor]
MSNLTRKIINRKTLRRLSTDTELPPSRLGFCPRGGRLSNRLRTNRGNDGGADELPGKFSASHFLM